MAALAGRLLAAAAGSRGRAGPGGPRNGSAVTVVPARSETITRSGAILPKPAKNQLSSMVLGTWYYLRCSFSDALWPPTSIYRCDPFPLRWDSNQ
ncbi:essential MCU regulator, mitochondrial isoform X2 [Chelonia mydas]|uniref:essential MCU regulator, mitochondrial isoform X2 n=1 Tax=Chelonia mydas TaxID=8469 RepID=UPI0018A1DF5F|nr:essential MCU regulator, mitochondrial isoform X2 [Chelonia mydas]